MKKRIFTFWSLAEEADIPEAKTLIKQ